jgi:ABC-2 type transport system ATP-binding protein
MERVAYLPEKLILPKSINSYDYLDSISEIYNFKGGFLMERYELKNDLIKNLSKGNLQKIGIIQMLMQNKNIYLFDEPLEGLSEKYIKIFINDLKRLKDEGKTIIISTHNEKKYMKITDNIYRLKEGKIIDERSN